MTRSTKLGLLACLYLAQGVPYGFFTAGLPAVMRQRGISLEDIGLTTLLFLPWALKFLWAPFVDRAGGRRVGRRRAWILPLQALAIGLMALLAFIEPDADFAAVLAVVIVVNLVSATQDIATDGLAVDVLAPSERGLGNGVQVAGYRLGMILSGGVLLMVIDLLGWRAAFLLMALQLVFATLPIAAYREPPAPPVTVEKSGSAVEALRGHFARPGAWSWALLLVLYKSFDALANPMVKPLMIDLGYSVGDVGAIIGAGGSVAGLLGALVGGWAVVRLGRHRALILFGLLQVLAVGTYVLPAAGVGGEAAMWASVVLDNFFGSTATAALFTLMMDACRPDHAATDYTVQASVVVVAAGVAGALSGYLAKALGFVGHFTATTGLSLLGLLLVAWLLRRGAAPREVVP